ncbi:MAG: histidine phosphatase family protein [Candidatus Aenigmarchaeota archaeon]|nr:histidine phosphatase family protein [Candidatus Aenigmarchaeota archaeon]
MASKKAVKITYFVHGSTSDNEKGIASGWNNPGLSELGKLQSLELKKIIRNRGFDAVFCSDLKRAAETAEIVFGGRAETIQDERLRECNYGESAGCKSKSIDAISEKHIEERFPGGECYKDVEKRIRSFLDYLLTNYSEKSIAMVGHRAPQLALEVILKNKTWEQAIQEDWRLKGQKGWRPGWMYWLEA